MQKALLQLHKSMLRVLSQNVLRPRYGTCAGAQQIAVSVPQSGLQQFSSGVAPQGLAGAGRRMLALPSRLVAISITPQPDQV